MPDCRRVADTYLAADQHFDGCDDPACKGCYPCVPRSDTGDPLEHCAGRNHCTEHVPTAALVCPRCVGRVREALRDIERLDQFMPREAEHKGVESEAANLAGPAPDTTDDIRAYANRQSSIAMGRVEGEAEDTDKHPLNVLGWYDMAYREDYNQPTTERITVARAVAYLEGQLDRIANDPEQDFGLFTHDVYACRAHLEAVIHDSRTPERSRVPCLDCGTRLERRYHDDAKNDDHRCPKCKRTYSAGEFARAKAEWLHSEGADRFVPISEAVHATGRSEFTVRTWMRRGLVETQHNRLGRLMVWWPDVRDQHRERELRDIRRKTG